MRLIDADSLKMEDFRHCMDCDSIIQVIKHLPVVDAEPVVHAHWWIGYFHDRVCSNCTHTGNYIPEPAFNYCPHCGAKMDLEGK